MSEWSCPTEQFENFLFLQIVEIVVLEFSQIVQSSILLVAQGLIEELKTIVQQVFLQMAGFDQQIEFFASQVLYLEKSTLAKALPLSERVRNWSEDVSYSILFAFFIALILEKYA